VAACNEDETDSSWVCRAKETSTLQNLGNRLFWLGDLQKFRHENIKVEFVNWMKTFGWEIKFVVDAKYHREYISDVYWNIKVPEGWQNFPEIVDM